MAGPTRFYVRVRTGRRLGILGKWRVSFYLRSDRPIGLGASEKARVRIPIRLNIWRDEKESKKLSNFLKIQLKEVPHTEKNAITKLIMIII